jgi:multidrug resistance efflux pump
LAFVRTDGLVERINVKEDSRVEKGQTLATLDPRDLDFEIKVAEKKFEILTQELMLLRRESGQEPSKLAESKLTELKRMSAWEELEYLKWKTRFLEIKAPVSGVVITREVDTLVGKKFKAGEPFCEIAVPSDLWVIIHVPEDRIGALEKGQIGAIYLNNEPGRPYNVHVAEIAPMAQAMPRLGNVYRVGATFVELPKRLKVGMKGIGKIHTGSSSLASMIGRRLLTRWNQLSIYY